MKLVNRFIPILPSASRTATVNGSDISNEGYRGIEVVVDITNLNAGTPNITVVIEGKDEASGKYFTLLSSAALAAVATTRLILYPAVTVAANLAASAPLSRLFRIRVTHGDAQAINYSVGASLLG